MADILKTFSSAFFFNEDIYNPVLSIVDKSALVQVMAWHLADAKPLPKTMLTKISDAMSSLGHNELKWYGIF